MILSERGKDMATRAANMLFAVSSSLAEKNGHVGKSIDEELNNIGAEVAVVEAFLSLTNLSEKFRSFLTNWDPINNVNKFKTVADIGNLEVRCIGRSSLRLIIRDDDDRSRLFCNVIGSFPEYTFGGWIAGSSVRSDWRTNFGHAGRPEVWAVPPAAKNMDWASLASIMETAI